MRIVLTFIMGCIMCASCLTPKKARERAYDYVAGDAVVDGREQEIIRNK